MVSKKLRQLDVLKVLAYTLNVIGDSAAWRYENDIMKFEDALEYISKELCQLDGEIKTILWDLRKGDDNGSA